MSPCQHSDSSRSDRDENIICSRHDYRDTQLEQRRSALSITNTIYGDNLKRCNLDPRGRIGRLSMFMFVEDSGKDLAIATMALSRIGAKGSAIFDTADRAIAFLQSVARGESNPPEAVILDLALRHGAGQDVLIEAKRSPQTSDIPVLVWTRTADQVQENICLSLGATAVLRKTRSGDELKTAVRSLRG